MNRALCVADGTGSDCAVFNGFVNRDFNIAYIVERVKNSDDVNAVFNRFFDEHSDNIIGIMLIPKQILPAQ